ncbi:MAG: hypothetical protein PVI20_00360 [Desulfobacteraceae bacterium]|jgi:hypothetical protein
MQHLINHSHLALHTSFTPATRVVETAYFGKQKPDDENGEKPLSKRLMENVHMQGFRNPEE